MSAEVPVKLQSREACPERGDTHICKIWGEGMPSKMTALDGEARARERARERGRESARERTRERERDNERARARWNE